MRSEINYNHQLFLLSIQNLDLLKYKVLIVSLMCVCMSFVSLNLSYAGDNSLDQLAQPIGSKPDVLFGVPQKDLQQSQLMQSINTKPNVLFGVSQQNIGPAKLVLPAPVSKEARPVRDLSKLIQKTNSVSTYLPVYSFVKGKSYIRENIPPEMPINANENSDNTSASEGQTDGLVDNNKTQGPKETYANIKKYEENSNTNTTKKFEYKNISTSVVTLRINNKIAYDFEVIVWPDGSISVPIKTLAEFVDVPVEQNHVNGNISFKQPVTEDTITIDHQSNKIIAGTNVIEIKNPKLIYMKQGFIAQDDIFIPEKLAQDLLDIETGFAKESYVMQLDTGRVLKALVEISEQAKELPRSIAEDPFNSVNQAEKENKMFKIKRINYNIGSSMNQSSGYGTNDANAAANIGFSSTGNFLGGEYNIGATTYYGQNSLMLSGYRASLDYIKPSYELSLGATNARLSELALPYSNLWGMRFGSVGAADDAGSVPRLVQGKADDNTYVELFINNVYSDKQLVQNGRFEFDSLLYPTSSMVQIKVEQVGQDGKRKIVYERKFSQDRDLLAPGQKQYLVFAGVDNSALSNNVALFGDTFNYGYTQPLKFVYGGKFRVGLSEQLTVGVNYAKDYIIRQPSKLFLDRLDGLSTARFYRTGRSSSGSIISFDMDYVPRNDLHISSEIGYSKASSKVDPAFDPDGTDFGGFIGIDYTRPNYSFRAKAFSYGPDFYSPGSSGLMDRRGVEIGSSWKMGPVSFYGDIARYNSNLDNYFEGGRSTVFDYNLYASSKIDEYSDIRLGVRSMGASNAFYTDRDTTYDVTINRKLSGKANLTINYAKTIRKTKNPYTDGTTKTSNNRINAELNYDAGKIGIIRLAHEMMMLDPMERLIMAEVDTSYYQQPIYSKNIRLSLDRSSRPIKGFTFSPNVGYRYGGDNKGLNFGMNLGYMFRSGRQIMLNYAYNSSFGRFMPGALSFGGSRSHSLSFNFVDTLGFGLPRGMKTNNNYQSPFDANTGIIKGTVYLDLNQNGIKDPNEEGISDIDINFQNLFDVTTDKNGNFIAANIPNGIRKVGVNKDTLPVMYTPTVADALVNVKSQRVYVADLGVMVTPGSITGKIEIDKDGLPNSDVVVLLLDKNNNEVKYTTTDSTGGYYISAVPPGQYTVAVDSNYLDYKGLQDSSNELHKVDIPLVTDDFVDIKDVNFKLIPKQGEVKKF